MQFALSLYGAWWFSLIYLIFAYGIWFIFPKYVQIKFSKIPDIKYVKYIYRYSYLLLLISSLFISFTINLHFFIGLFLYICGLSIYIIAIFYFSINEPDLLVNSGIYRYSRHPVYFGFFIMWIGVSVCTFSIIVFLITIIIGFLSYIIALEEEKLCIIKYGESYKDYKDKVNLILGKK